MEFEEKRSFLHTQLANLTNNDLDFEQLALDLFSFQRKHNPTYNEYLGLIDMSSRIPQRIQDIPCMPIQFFKERKIQTGSWSEDKVFTSSGTGGRPSLHYIRDLAFYKAHSKNLFESHFGEPDQYCFLALLPGYLEREGSSLIEMVNHFIQLSSHSTSGFYLNQYKALYLQIQQNQQNNIPTILFAVSFALLDFINEIAPDLNGIQIVETGGMKTSKKEFSKREIFTYLKKQTNCTSIHSEYGMTELLSQCYAINSLRFQCPHSLRVFTTEINDPFEQQVDGKSGQLNVIDLANIDTCAFIQTEDLAIINSDKTFELLGRLHLSEMRGCNLLLEELQ